MSDVHKFGSILVIMHSLIYNVCICRDLCGQCGATQGRYGVFGAVLSYLPGNAFVRSVRCIDQIVLTVTIRHGTLIFPLDFCLCTLPNLCSVYLITALFRICLFQALYNLLLGSPPAASDSRTIQERIHKTLVELNDSVRADDCSGTGDEGYRAQCASFVKVSSAVMALIEKHRDTQGTMA